MFVRPEVQQQRWGLLRTWHGVECRGPVVLEQDISLVLPIMMVERKVFPVLENLERVGGGSTARRKILMVVVVVEGEEMELLQVTM